ncbi:hypothetical protein [Lysobacter sp. Root690]|uniref:hypothetical protein n=1 Tax=Lysobacter sp. Root690 TaxID=1736588 RepID=UPI0012FA6208|nr:hypothetical protein [Lysobacter sp. Root690]
MTNYDLHFDQFEELILQTNSAAVNLTVPRTEIVFGLLAKGATMKASAITLCLMSGVAASAFAQPQKMPIKCADLKAHIAAGLYSQCSPTVTSSIANGSRAQTQCSHAGGQNVLITIDTFSSGNQACSTQVVVPD